MQAIGYGIVMPIYGAIYLLTSPTASPNVSDLSLARRIRVREHSKLQTIPMSISFGFILPAILMSLPIFSTKTHQYLVVVWQLSPLWVTAFQFSLPIVYRHYLSSPRIQHDEQRESTTSSNRTALHRVYQFASLISAVTFLTTQAFIGMVKVLPGAFPTFSPHITSSSVFLPPLSFHNPAPIESMVQGAHNFFQFDYYIGSLAALTWAVVLSTNTARPPRRVKARLLMTGAAVLMSPFVGPATVFIWMLEARDKGTLEAGRESEERKT